MVKDRESLLPRPGPQSIEGPHLLSFPKIIPEKPGDVFAAHLCFVRSKATQSAPSKYILCSCPGASPAWGLSHCPSSFLSAATTSRVRASPSVLQGLPRFMGIPNFCLVPPRAPRSQPARGVLASQSSGPAGGKGNTHGPSCASAWGGRRLRLLRALAGGSATSPAGNGPG